MRVVRIRIGETVNLGDYNSARAEVEVEVGPGDEVEDAKALARAELDVVLGRGGEQRLKELRTRLVDDKVIK